VIDVELATIRARLKDRQPRLYTGEAKRRAAVAAVLRQGPLDTEVLFIRRAERQGDPWSGQMAFPGGHRDAQDASMLATAIRETRDEVGLDLSEHELIAPLDEHPATLAGVFTGLVIAPFVFALRGTPELTPNYEVAAIVWGSLGKMARGEIDTHHALSRGHKTIQFPAYGVGPHVVWGLTHRMLQSMLDNLAPR
jgi:8-oxo-dGTP pyrophosphatase MutT (NUDIX family)